MFQLRIYYVMVLSSIFSIHYAVADASRKNEFQQYVQRRSDMQPFLDRLIKDEAFYSVSALVLGHVAFKQASLRSKLGSLAILNAYFAYQSFQLRSRYINECYIPRQK